LYETAVVSSQTELAFLEPFRRVNKDDLLIIDRLNGACGNDRRDWLLFDRDCGRDERAGPPHTLAVGDLGHNPRRTRLLVEKRADKHDFAFSLLRYSTGADRHRLPLFDGGQIGRADREFYPDPVEVDDDKEFGLQVVPPNRCAKIDF